MERKTIGGLIAALRKANGMTQKDLAEKLNVSDKSVSRWERDDGAPDLSLIPVIAEIFGITCDELLRGERRSPEQQTETPENVPSAKGEKQRQRLLALALSKYKTRSMIAVCLALVGMLAAMAGNFGFNRAYLGFLAGCVFYLTAAVTQAIFVNGAFLSVSEEEDVGNFKRQVVTLTEGVWTLTAVLLGVCLPLTSVSDSFAGLSRGAWLYRGAASGFSALTLCAVLLWLANGQLVKRNVYEPKTNFAHNHRWQKYCALLLTAVLALTFACQWGLNQFSGARELADWTSFDSLESFKAFIEQDVERKSYNISYEPGCTIEEVQPLQGITYYDENGNEITEDEARTAHFYDNDEIVFTYIKRNETVRDIRYGFENGELRFLEVLTWDAYYRGQRSLEAFNVLFGLGYAVEYLAASLLYLVKRKKA